MTWLPWLVCPLAGGVFTWAAAKAAFALLFRPRRPRLGVQGLLPRRQAEIAEAVGAAVARELPVDDLIAELERIDLEPHLTALVDAAVAEKVEEWRRIPVVGGLITVERLAGIRAAVVRSLLKRQPLAIDALRRLAHERLDIASLVRTKLAATEPERIESLLREAAGRSLRVALLLCFLVGAAIGAIEAAILAVL
jgi:uncharacterized membrane protein YheB (UPF0754 family)